MKQVLALIALLLLASCVQGPLPSPLPSVQPTAVPQPIQPAVVPQPDGRVLFTITDKPASLGSFRQILLYIDETSVHKDGRWLPVTKERRIDLLESKNVQLLLGDVTLEPGTYEQVRLRVNKIEAVEGSGTVLQVKLPSNELKLVGNLEVEGGEISLATIDFALDKSLHQTGSGKLVLLPVIKLTTQKGVDADIRDGKVTVRKGTRVDEQVTGMNERGEQGADKIVPITEDIALEGDVIVKGEKTVEVVTLQPEKLIKEFTVLADDFSLEPADLSVRKGDTVKITFKVSEDRVYYGGLSFNSNVFAIKRVPSGGQQTVTFTADKSFTYTSNWPSSGVQKAVGKVLVE